MIVCVLFRCLERSAYNHITATYYLLAERLLRKRKEANGPLSCAGEQSGAGQKPVLSPLALSPRFELNKCQFDIESLHL